MVVEIIQNVLLRAHQFELIHLVCPIGKSSFYPHTPPTELWIVQLIFLNL